MSIIHREVVKQVREQVRVLSASQQEQQGHDPNLDIIHSVLILIGKISTLPDQPPHNKNISCNIMAWYTSKDLCSQKYKQEVDCI